MNTLFRKQRKKSMFPVFLDGTRTLLLRARFLRCRSSPQVKFVPEKLEKMGLNVSRRVNDSCET